MYSKLLFAAALALPVAAFAAVDKKPTPQQEKFSACSKEASAKKLKRDERNRFMSTCLSAKPPAAGPQAR